jgi:cysteine-rich repeat protein
VCGPTCAVVAGNPIACGDGNVDPGEDCDDGNRADGDGCPSICRFGLPLGSDCLTNFECGSGRCAQAGYTWQSKKCAPEGMVYVRGGYFEIAGGTYNTSAPSFIDKRPVYISYDFFIDETEVSQLRWQDFLPVPGGQTVRAAQMPVQFTNWYDGLAFANWSSQRDVLPSCYDLRYSTYSVRADLSNLAPGECTGFRLPTSAEIEYAARGGVTGDFYPDWRSFVWAEPETRGPGASGTFTASSPRPVGSKLPNAWGVYDMCGNMAETGAEHHSIDAGASVTVVDPGFGASPIGPTRGSDGGDFRSGNPVTDGGPPYDMRFGYAPFFRTTPATSDPSQEFMGSMYRGVRLVRGVDVSLAVCGDSMVGPGEWCDDGNTAWGDGCGGTCRCDTGTHPEFGVCEPDARSCPLANGSRSQSWNPGTLHWSPCGPIACNDGYMLEGELCVPKFASVSAGGYHTCAVRSDGTAQCWGLNAERQLGDGTTTYSTVPKTVAFDTLFESISAGDQHTCGVLVDHRVACWGSNLRGQIGVPGEWGYGTPQSVVGLDNVVKVSSGSLHTCALKINGQLYCWGYNFQGQLGTGDTTQRTTPTLIEALNSVVDVSAGAVHTCAITTSGDVYCWGFNSSGQLGDGTIVEKRVPTKVGSALAGTLVSAGFLHTCAISNSGVSRCWGENNQGQLGDGTVTRRTLPVSTLLSDVLTSVAVGGTSAATSFACARAASGGAFCWGNSSTGQLGNGATGFRSTPSAVSLAASVAGLDAGGQHACAVTTDGRLSCWGRNANGQLGVGSTVVSLLPVSVAIVP